jgi:hypothetical protein
VEKLILWDLCDAQNVRTLSKKGRRAAVAAVNYSRSTAPTAKKLHSSGIIVKTVGKG